MADIAYYLQAATKENTRRSYQFAVEHYEVSWGGFLPATAESIALYLADQAEELSINTFNRPHNAQNYYPCTAIKLCYY